MPEAQILFAFYGTLAAFALWACWADRDLRWLAFTLAGSFTASNAVWFLGTTEMRPTVYSLCEVVILIFAFLAWRTTGYRALIALVVVSILSIGANIGFASITEPRLENINTYEVLTNICYAAECVIAFGTGIADGLRTNRFSAGASRWWRRSASHAARRRNTP